ncbi:hypothetical protein QQS21_010948 [Conoideocrella luteorostrata]|uniref:Uncharacterized protein n=1 Tax=Conoideocrella luteorostrata TaxID=1105319 RepID=A0AAJ0FNV9_9HYPO|nr:hypothetical protein QQS21_010948 [Conoideocrella luteorostrata]
MGVDDLLLGLTHHWCRDRSVFTTEGDRLDLSTVMLFQSYTACRPAELVDGTKSRGLKDPMLDDSDDENSSIKTSGCRNRTVKLSIEAQHIHPTVMPRETETTSDLQLDKLEFSGGDDTVDPQSPSTGGDDAEAYGEPIRMYKALCYEDIVLLIVQDPSHGDRDVLAMEVFFRYYQGADRKPKPYIDSGTITIFLFRETPLPILCPVSHFSARAIRDDAIEFDGFNHAAPFFSSHIGRRAIKVHWKPSVLKTPVFRRSIQTVAGWVKSEIEPMKYSTHGVYLDIRGCDLGSKEKWTSHCFRRGHANALLGVTPDSIVDQVMRHDPLAGCMQNAYQNYRVGFNTQDVFLERDPSADGLTKAFTHMSIRCNLEVPRELLKDELDEFPSDPEVTGLKEQIRQMALHMRQDYGFIKQAPEVVKEAYQRLRRDLKNAEKPFKGDKTKTYQKVYRWRIHNDELQKQLSRTAGRCDALNLKKSPSRNPVWNIT